MLKTLSVSELSQYVTSIFEAEELLHNIKVYGEISNLSCVRGNLYFNLKDENSLMPCIMFGASASVKEGDQVLLCGSMKYYGKGGKLNFYVTSLMPYGSGILYQKYIELKNKLEKEGLFDLSHKKELPKDIKKIGVITSKTGAVLHDIETVSHRRNPSLDIIVFPAKVQGDGAEITIIKGLEYFDKQKDIDIIIIARGGGSIEDLQPFNTEILARKIFETKKPVVSAVGHETDYTICDFVSSIRAATPSVAAELVTRDMSRESDKILEFVQKVKFLVENLIDEKEEKFENDIDKLKNAFEKKYIKLKFDFDCNRLKLSSLKNTLFQNISQEIEIQRNRLELLNPKNISKMGWAKILDKSGKTIKSVSALIKHKKFQVELSDGKIDAIVDNS